MFIFTKTKKRTTRLLYTTALSLFLAANASAQTWAPVGASSNGISSSWGSFQNLVGDQSGNLYCSFYDGSVTKGSVMKYDGSAWSYLGGAGITPGSATYSSLTLAANGDVFYSHQLGWPASGISVQKYDGTAWSTLPSAESATVNFQSIASNGSNQPVVAYSSGGNLKVKSFDGTNWSVLGTGLPAGTPTYIDAKCVNDTVYVGFVNSGMKVYKIAASASATDSWIEVGTTSFGATSSEQFRSAIAVDNNNDVFVAFTSLSAGGNKLNVKKYDHTTGQWSDVGSANFTDYRVHYVDIALDNNHTPYVAFSNFENTPNNRNFVMKFDGTAWITLGNTDVSGAEAKWNSLIISNNKPILAYSDEPNDAVMVKEFLSPGCTNTLPGTAVGSTGCVTFNYQQNPVTYTTVRAADGNVWLQQNLGSSQVATASNDASAYGDYFQWGRWDDGHQLTTSPLTAAPPSPNNPAGIGTGNSNFYSAGYSNPNNWWSDGLNTDTWTGATPADASATNGCDPCRVIGSDWRLPTTAELEAILSAENITNISSAFASNLKLVGAGMRDYSGMFVDGTRAYLWSGSASSVDGWGETVYISPNVAITNYGGRDGGMPLRCMKANPVASSIDVATQNNVPATITTNAGTLQMTATILPATVNQNVTWSIVPASGSATISASGLVTAQGNGTVYAKAISVADPTKTDSLMITISGQNSCAPVSSFYENFDAPTLTCCNMGVVPECWNSISTATGANQIISNTTPASGANNIYQFGYGAGKISIVVMREVNNINAGTHQFRFKLRANSGPGDLDFGYITDITDASTFVTIQTISVTNSSYNDPIAERIFTVPTTVPSNARLAIRNPGTSWAGFYWDDAYWEPIPMPPVQSIDVTTQNNVAATITSNGGTLQTVATILPAAANQDVTWSIVNGTGTATISATGLVTAQSNGTVWAKAVSVANPTLNDSIEITISGQIVSILSLDVQTQNNISPLIFSANGTLQVIAVITPANTSNQNVTWSIVNGTGAATISATGLVTAQTNGTVWAKAVSVENTNVKDSLLITISGQSSAGMDDHNALSVNFYPNPVQKLLTIEVALPEGTEFPVQIIDASGRLVYSNVLRNNKSQLDLSALPGGTYRLIIHNTYNQQLIIE